jgi:hypothetical protein
MDWRDFKITGEGFKGLKGFKSPEPTPLKPLKPLKPERANLKGHDLDLHRLIADTLERIDRSGHPWDGWRESRTGKQRQQQGEIEGRIDDCCIRCDRPGLLVVLAEYQEFICLGGGKTLEKEN